MLARAIFLLVGLSIGATQIPVLMDKFQPRPESSVAKTEIVAEAAKPQPVSLGGVNLKADARGHFNATFRINGKSFDGLIDTVLQRLPSMRRLHVGSDTASTVWISNTRSQPPTVRPWPPM